jgi:pimeloyl-ACP methyl ester carboxylesterase
MNVIKKLLLFAALSSAAFALETSESVWKGFAKTSFTVAGHNGYVVAPKTPLKGNPWVWRARFPNYHSEIDAQLLADGYHIAHVDTKNRLGSTGALNVWEAFYKEVTTTFGLNKKMALYGVSRGGLFIYRWAKNHPDTVNCIYGDSTVGDIKSWPKGAGAGDGADGVWKILLQEYGLDEEAAMAYQDNPIDNLEPIANAQIPILHLVCEQDIVVPPAENTYLIKKNLEALGHNQFRVIQHVGEAKKNGHHFPLLNGDEVVEFLKMNNR